MTRGALAGLLLASCSGGGGGEGEGEVSCDLLRQDCAEGEGCYVEPGGTPFCAAAGKLGTSAICGDDQVSCAAGYYCTPDNVSCCPFCEDGAPDSECPQEPFAHVCCPRDDLPEGVSLCLPEKRGCE